MASRGHAARRWLVAFVVFFGGFVGAETIATPTAYARDDSAATFAAAKKLFEGKSFEKALPLFQDAYAQSKSPNARMFVARCLRELGRVPEAYDEMSATVREATERAATDPKYVPTRDSAAAELALLEPQIGKLVVGVADPPPGLAVSVNGKPLDATKLGSVVTIMPGKVTVEATAPGKTPSRREEDVAGGQTKTVTLALADGQAATPGPALPKPGAPPKHVEDAADGGSFFGPVRIAGLAVAGVGVGGLVAFAVTGSMAKSEYDALDTECGGARCPASDADRVSKGRTLTIVADVSAGIGGAALVAGAVMFIFGGDAEPDAKTAGQVRPVIGGGPDGASVGAIVHF